MRALLYHDVAPAQEWPATGFQGGDADIYKLTPADFDTHLAALEGAGRPPALVGRSRPDSWLLTFDDGGGSALTVIAPSLEGRGWRGHFFMTTGRIGTPGFLDVDGIRALAARGHIVGSHSVTHPLAMASLPFPRLVSEWSESLDALEHVLGTRPGVASIPGGAFSTAVAEAAGRAGVRVLFTSEPTANAWMVGPVLCLGRFTIWRGMPAAAARSFATGRGVWPIRQRAMWEAKKVAKAILGPGYLHARKRMLDRAPARAPGHGIGD